MMILEEFSEIVQKFEFFWEEDKNLFLVLILEISIFLILGLFVILWNVLMKKSPESDLINNIQEHKVTEIRTVIPGRNLCFLLWIGIGVHGGTMFFGGNPSVSLLWLNGYGIMVIVIYFQKKTGWINRGIYWSWGMVYAFQFKWSRHTQSHSKSPNQGGRKWGYYAGVKITQLPIIEKERKDQIENSRTLSKGGKLLYYNIEQLSSWICEFLGKNFAMEIDLQNGIQWRFYTRVNSGQKAQNLMNQWEKSFKTNFPGLDCEGWFRPVLQQEYSKSGDTILQEIKLPPPPFLQRLPICRFLIGIMEQFRVMQKNAREIPYQEQIQNQNQNPNQTFILNQITKKYGSFKIMFLFQKIRNNKASINSILKNKEIDPAIKAEMEALWVGPTYQMQLFVEYPDQNNKIKNQLIKEQFDQTLRENITNWKGQYARIQTSSWTEIQILRRISPVTRSCYITPFSGDFDFRGEWGLRRARKLPSENVTPIFLHPLSQNNSNSPSVLSRELDHVAYLDHLDLGFICQNSVKSDLRAYIQRDSLAQNMLIAGTPGTGKTVLLKNIIHQLEQTTTGLLILNTAKSGEERNYSTYRNIRYGAPDFTIPYGIIVNPRDLEGDVKRICSNIAAVLGMLDFSYRILYIPCLAYYRLKNKMPTLKELFYLGLKYLEKNPYAGREQQNIFQALNQRGLELTSNPVFMQTINGDHVADWLQGVLFRGERVFIDLSGCDIVIKQFLTVCILNQIDILTRSANQINTVKLNTTIIIDEAHDLFGAVTPGGDYLSDESVRQQGVARVIRPYMLEYRSRGIGLLISDQRPSGLMDAVRDQAGIKVLFRIGYECARQLVPNPELQEFIMQQANYRTVVLDGTRGEIYQVHTHPDMS